MNIVDDPIEELKFWLAKAKEEVGLNYNAMALATVDEQGAPDVRYVLLKKVSPAGVEFFTNRGSAKAGQLLASSSAALALYWRETDRQVRLRGKVSELGRERVAEYFATRSRASQLGAWASTQSQPLADMDELRAKVEAAEERFKDGAAVELPEHWTGFLLEPAAIEFWREGEARLHERVRYVRAGSSWQAQRLYP